MAEAGTSPVKVLLCANPDLNYIDGSSIWAQTIAEVCAGSPNVQVHLLARTAPKRPELFRPLQGHDRIHVLDGPGLWRTRHKKSLARLGAQQLATLAKELDGEENYDIVIVRGLDIALNLARVPDLFARAWLYLTDIPQSIDLYDDDLHFRVRALARGCGRVLSQSAGFTALWRELDPDLPPTKIISYSPVVPDPPEGLLQPVADRAATVAYAGKFKPEWNTLEMVRAWPAISDEVPDAAFLVIGDKFHEDGAGFREAMERALTDTEGVSWLRGQSRAAVQEALRSSRVGLSWRSDRMDDILEYSTKVLEYGAAGCAVILNRNRLHEELLGADYPLYANSDDEYRAAVLKALTDDETASAAASAVGRLASQHLFSTRVAEIGVLIDEFVAEPPADRLRIRERLKVLVAGHDLKFFTPLQRRLELGGGFEFSTDKWGGHNTHDEATSRALLQEAQVIVAEWCLGNVEWYSRHKRPDQRLVARFHSQERKQGYLRQADWEKIDHITFVSEFIRDEAEKIFGFPEDKTSVIANFIDDRRFRPSAKAGDARLVIGLIGAAPASKRLDIAVDVLERLLQEDTRYTLRVKGRHPLDYAWLLSRSAERRYYENVFSRINSDSLLSHHVIFDPPGDDVPQWLNLVGHLLSPSDFESFHMAVGEALLTRTPPVVWPWPGAAELWGDKHIVSGVDEAVGRVLAGDTTDFALPSSLSPGTVVGEWRRLLADEAHLHRA